MADIMETLLNVAVDPAKNKHDVMLTLKQLVDANPALLKAMGSTLSEDDLNLIKQSTMVIDDTDVAYKKKGDEIEVHKVKKSKKMVELYVKEATKEEARYFTDLYYSFQKFRIGVENQMRAINQGKDQSDTTHRTTKPSEVDTPLTMAFREHILNQFKIIENDIKGCLADYSDRMPMGRYAKSICGIGPVFATVLCSYLDIPDKETLPPDRQVYTAGNWVSYAGLNDNNRPWLKDDIAKQYVLEAIKENNGIINEDTVRILCTKTQWSYDHYYEFCCDKKTGKFKGFSESSLIKASKLIPFNKNLKKTMYLIGQSFIKVQNNPKSVYGELYKIRLQYEIDRNENGGNAEYCAKNIHKLKDKKTEAYKCYSQGKCPKGQLIARAHRHTVKILLNHLFEFAWIEKYHTEPPVPFAFTLNGVHKDYIKPEVPYKDYLTPVED